MIDLDDYPEDIRQRIELHSGSEVIVDANLLWPWLAARTFPSEHRGWRTHVRLEDLQLVYLDDVIRRFAGIVVTPHLLTEVSNLSGKLPPSMLRSFREMIRLVAEEWSETFTDCRSLTATSGFVELGLADAAVIDAVGQNRVTLTSDLRLYIALQSLELNVINFNHLFEA